MPTQLQENDLIIRDYMDELLTEVGIDEPQISEEDKRRLEDLFARGIQAGNIPRHKSISRAESITGKLTHLNRPQARLLLLEALQILKGIPAGQVRQLILKHCQRLNQHELSLG